MIVIEMGYSSFVMSKEDAMTMVSILERSELYKQKYWSKSDRAEKGMPEDQDYTHHVYPNDKEYSMKIISDDMYRLAKLAGKPEKD